MPGRMTSDSVLPDSEVTEIRMNEFTHGKNLMLGFYIGSFCGPCMTQPVQRLPMDTLEDPKKGAGPGVRNESRGDKGKGHFKVRGQEVLLLVW